jgi:UDP-N-acetylmuramoyl-tripeptide--D-alanyl-D-alanine ligase
MISYLKKFLYFPVASYFRFFAAIKFKRWNPRVILVTGSNGKTTTVALIESQLGDEAVYSHHANSSYGIPFNILGLERKTLLAREWLGLFALAPFKAFAKNSAKKLYVVEADCDRPGESIFLSFLKPEVTIWLSSSRTHSMNFDTLVREKKFGKVEDAIAYEYGYFLEATSKLCIVNSENPAIADQLARTKAGIAKISLVKKNGTYSVGKNGTIFRLNGHSYSFDYLLPEVTLYSILATLKLLQYLGKKPDPKFKNFILPPGRSGIFKGIKDTTIIDSSYNANLSSMIEVINMFNKISSGKKWAVVGDMLEQGNEEKDEHEKLAKILIQSKLDRVILLGPRINKFGMDIIKKIYGDKVTGFENPKDVLNFLLSNIQGGETILFKGARFMEGIIENLMDNKKDAKLLSRREKVWDIRRKKWGL